MGQDVGGVDAAFAQGAGEGAEAGGPGGQGKDAGGGGVHGPERSERGAHQQGQVGIGIFPAEGLEGRHGENGVAEPVDAADQDARRGAGGAIDWRGGDHQE